MRAWMLCALLGVAGCATVTVGVYAEKDWRTEPLYTSPDLRTKIKVEVSKEFDK